MELQTEGVDRVLEALSPTLAAELERVVNETRQTLEAEFEKRIGWLKRSSKIRKSNPNCLKKSTLCDAIRLRQRRQKTQE